MSNDATKRPGFAGTSDEDALEAEFDEWDKHFDAMLVNDAAQSDVGKAGTAARTDADANPPAQSGGDTGAGAGPARAADAGARGLAPDPGAGELAPDPGASELASDPGHNALPPDPGTDEFVLDAAGASFGAESAELEFELEIDADEPPHSDELEIELSVPSSDSEELGVDALFDNSEALGELLGTSPDVDIVVDSDIESGEAELFPPPIDQTLDNDQLSVPIVEGRAGYDGEDTDGDHQVLTSALRPPDPTPLAQPPEDTPPAGVAAPPHKSVLSEFTPMSPAEDEFDAFAADQSAQVTKVVNVDEDLIAATSATATSVPRHESATPKSRRKPAIVRRDELERRRRERETRVGEAPDDYGDDDAFAAEDTEIIDEERLGNLATSSANLVQPATTSESAEDFYDDIVINDAEEAANAPAQPPSRPEAATPRPRRVSMHVVRRSARDDGRESPRVSKPVLRKVTRVPVADSEILPPGIENHVGDLDMTLNLRRIDREVGDGGPGALADEELKAIISNAARKWRSQSQGSAAPYSESGSSDELEPEWEFEEEEANEPTAAWTRMPPDSEAVVPTPPPAKIPTVLPTLDLGEVAVPAEVAALSVAEVVTRVDELNAELNLYERQLLGGTSSVWLLIEAGRLAEQLGDLDRARNHYRAALVADPDLVPAMRGLRRIESAAGYWTEGMQYLEGELVGASPPELQGLRAHFLDLLMASGERTRARTVTEQILAAEPDNLHALMTAAELAFVADQEPPLADAVARLSELVEDLRLSGSLCRLSGHLHERAGAADPAAAAFAAAASRGAGSGLLAATRAARQRGDMAAAEATMAQLIAGLDLARREPGYTAALNWRRALWAQAGGAGDACWDALRQTASLAPEEPVVSAELAELAASRGDHATAAAAFARVGEAAPSAAEQALAQMRAARHLAALGRKEETASALRQAQVLDLSNPRAAVALERTLMEAGDVDALIEIDREVAAADPAGAVFERVRAARRLVEQGRFDEAIAELEAGRAAGDAPEIQEALDWALALAGRTEERAELLANLVDNPSAVMDPDTALVRAALASEAHARHVSAALAAAMDEAAGDEDEDEDEPRSPAMDSVVTLRALFQQALAAALAAWNRVLATDPNATLAHVASVHLAETLGDPDVLEDTLARAQFAAPMGSRAVTLALRRVEVLAMRTTGEVSEAEQSRAEDLLREATSLSPSDPRIALRRVLMTVSTQRFKDAAMVLDERARALPQDVEAAALRYRAATWLLEPVDEPGLAVELLESVGQAQPEFRPAQELLRTAYARLGETAPMPAHSAPGDDLRAVTNNDFTRLVRQAEHYEQQMGDRETAMALFAKALVLRPGDLLVREELDRVARAAGASEPLRELAQGDLDEALAAGDHAAQADAYEALGDIEHTLRGDAAAALPFYQRAYQAAPHRPIVHRVLERAYLRAQRWDQLLALYSHIEPTVPREAMWLVMEQARLAEHGEAAGPAATSDTDQGPEDERGFPYFTRAYELDTTCRLALFRLETRARKRGIGPELAALEAAVAAYMAGDGRAQAAFLTRAGETLMALGNVDEAVAYFREADEAARTSAALQRSPSVADGGEVGYEPALFGWRTAALQGQLWPDVAAAVLRDAEQTSTEPERAALYHLAGVTLMDRAQRSEDAIAAFDQVLKLEPGHDDAFVRMRILLAGIGDHEGVVRLLEQRLEIETHPARQVEIHRDLAELLRNYLEDLDRARDHLRAIVELLPEDDAAIAALAEIAWERGAWQEAADTLLQQARSETEPGVVKNIFYRLGLIYGQHLPNPGLAIKAFKRVLTYDDKNRSALEQLTHLGMVKGDWKLTVAAHDRLAKLATDDDAVVTQLVRMGQIYEQHLGDAARAERSYRRAVERLPTSEVALTALVNFFESRGDARSARVHLDRVAGFMRTRVDETITDGDAYRVIARVMRARHEAGGDGSLGPARCAAQLALILGAGGAEEQTLVADAADTIAHAAGLEKPEIDDLLFPSSVSHGVRQILGRLGDRIAKHVGVDLRRYDVGRGDRLRKRDNPVVAAFEQVAEEMGMEVPVVYAAQKHPNLLVAEPTNPVSVILGASLTEVATPEQLRFVAGRSLKLALTSLTAPARMSADEFAALLVALLRQFDPKFTSRGVAPHAVDAEQQRLRRLIPSGMVQQLRPFAIGIARADFDPARIWAGIIEMGNRAGLMACGCIESALEILRIAGGHADLHAAFADPEVAALIRFSVSEDHATVRGILDG